MKPKLSIVIPTIGRIDLFKRALHSALEQTDPSEDYEIVVLDNCSDDGTWDYVQGVRNAKVKAYRNSQRLTLGENWNKAVTLSSGEYVYILQDDNLCLPEMVSTISGLVAEHDGPDCVCFANWYIDGQGNSQFWWQPKREEVLSPPAGLMRFAQRWTATTSFLVFSRAVYDRCGGFEEESTAYPVVVDLEFVLRWMIDSRAALVRDYLAMHRHWGETLTVAATQQVPRSVTEHPAVVTAPGAPGLFTAMTYAVARVFRCAVESGRLDADQLVSLREALVQTFLIDVFRAFSGLYERGLLPGPGGEQ